MADFNRIRVACWGLLLLVQGADAQVKTKPQGEVTLSATAALEATALVVTYHVSNETGATIVLWDQMVDYDGNGEKIDPKGAYVLWGQPDGIRLIRAELPLPPNLNVYRNEVPYARTVAAHSAVEGVIRLALPVEEASPFYSPPDFWNVVACTKVHLEIGWREQGPEMKITPITLHGVTVKRVEGQWSQPRHRLLQTSIELATRLKLRRDDFDRRGPVN